MGELKIDRALLKEVAERLDLRETNRKAIESVLLRTSMHYDVDEKTGPFECIVDSATGVGKTYVLAGLIEYLALVESPAKNFLIIAPGRTIRNKTIRNFTRGDKKSLTGAMRSRPHLITSDNFDNPATRSIMDDDTKTKVYVFTVQALTSKTGDGRATHEFQEGLGSSFYEWLAQLDDLVILADEHHCYRAKENAKGFANTIAALNPEVVVGLTATPEKKDDDLVVYRYPLAAAIADRLVKTPVIVGRKDDRDDVETKLLDGVSLLKKKEAVARRYCQENGLDPVNPVMLVVAKDIAEATEFRNILDSVSFDGGAWVNKTLLVHSKLTGDEKEEALAALDDVEEAHSPVRIIINVGMLKEGWDVKNVYVIASMRASVSDVLTEQTLGRGLRLPFGEYTGIDFLDTLEVLAHERYEALLEKRKVLNQAFIDYYTYASTRVLPDGTTTVITEHADVDVQVIPDPDLPDDGTDPDRSTTTPVIPDTIVDIESRNDQADTEAEDEDHLVDYEPLGDRESIVIPKVVQTPRAAIVSLNDIDTDDYVRFDRLGETLTRDFSNDLKRTKIVGKRVGNQVMVDVEKADDVEATLAFDIPMSESRAALVNRVMDVRGVQRRATELGAAARIVDRLIAAMGDEASASLSAFGDRCAQRLAAEVMAALIAASDVRVEFDEHVEMVPLNKTRQARKKRVAGHADGGFDRSVSFNGWGKNLYSHAWFDSKPEYKLADALDNTKSSVVVWARLHRNDVPITWNAENRQYNPDFAVIEEVANKRHGWLVETKADKDMTSDEVVAKRRAARRWANTVNASPVVHGVEWHYLLLSERDVEHAQGNWEFLKGFGK